VFFYIVGFLLYIVHVKYIFQIEITGAVVGKKKEQKKDKNLAFLKRSFLSAKTSS